MISNKVLIERIDNILKKDKPYCLVFNSLKFEEINNIVNILKNYYKIYNINAWKNLLNDKNTIEIRKYKSIFLKFREGKRMHLFATTTGPEDGEYWYVKKERLDYEIIDIKQKETIKYKKKKLIIK